jgi:hypothetical protein
MDHLTEDVLHKCGGEKQETRNHKDGVVRNSLDVGEDGDNNDVKWNPEDVVDRGAHLVMCPRCEIEGLGFRVWSLTRPD